MYYFINITPGLFSEPFFGKRYESFWSSVLRRTSRHQILMVSQAAAIGSNTLFPYTHGKNPQIKAQSPKPKGLSNSTQLIVFLKKIYFFTICLACWDTFLHQLIKLPCCLKISSSFSLPVCYCAKVAATCKNILVFGRLDKFSSYLGWACVGPAFSHLRFGYVPLNLENFIFFERK
jgi:hypothetical protein